MNQIQIQKEQTREQRVLQKGNYLVANNKVRRSPYKESRELWMVGSYSTPKKWYVVRWHSDLGIFTCPCEAFKYSHDNRCLHILACALFEGGHA